VVAARRITAGEDAAKEIDDLDLFDGSVRSCPHKGKGALLGTGIPSATVTGHFGHAPERCSSNMKVSSFARPSTARRILQKTPVLIPEALHFTAAVRWLLRYHSHLAAHCIALSRILQRRRKTCGEEKSRQRLLLDAQGASIFIGSSRRDGLVM
jgi:hypothetical protein